IEAVRAGARPDPAALAESLSENDRRLLFEILFESAPEGTWEEAESCLSALKKRQLEHEIAELQTRLAAQPSPTERREIFTRAQQVRKLLGELQ
ncbi:MAG TPA: hypothetical protein VKV15_28425, partial [Bryobacteraceae bacterium]|nr:hypothetical protein [Bryobacteraceae bacterium]